MYDDDRFSVSRHDASITLVSGGSLTVTSDPAYDIASSSITSSAYPIFGEVGGALQTLDNSAPDRAGLH